MDVKRQRMRQKQLDRQLMPLRAALPSTTPQGGWIKAIREALGMNFASFSKRLNVAVSTAHQLEQAELSGTITLNRLRKAADALECDVAIVFLPRVPLAETVERRANEKALARLQRVGHSMNMEAQGIGDAEFEDLLKETTMEILVKGESVWN